MADSTLDELAAFQERWARMPRRRADLIAAARAAGHTWGEIGAVLGMTEHGAIKAANPSDTPPGRPKKPAAD